MTAAFDADAYIERIKIETERLAVAARHAGPDAPIPTCPDWTMRDLVHHVGEVQRWATVVVDGKVPKPSAVPADHLGPLPSDDDLGSWLIDGGNGLVDALRVAPEDLQCFVFLADPPSPLVFWARRQAHETEMHRIDAESALGRRTPLNATMAADGIDELLSGFVPRRHTSLHAEPARTIAFRLTDAPGEWHVTISPDTPVTVRESRAADCTVRGKAADLYLALWNRAGVGPLEIAGDAGLLDQFREHVQVKWS
jgi:uncharacterized protein (TIGR03083 family)